MCGRYTLTASLFKIKTHFSAEMKENFEWAPRFNISPGQKLPVIVAHKAEHEASSREMKLMRWGLIPSWAKDPAIGFKMINARGETVAEKPSFKQSLLSRRCLVPADSFYEWKKVSGKKIPQRILPTDHEPFGFAGIWDSWTSPQGEVVDSFTIITTAANDQIRGIHDRMPVIFRTPDEIGRWLDPALREAKGIVKLLEALPNGALESYPVSTAMNSGRNDVPSCIEAVTDDSPRLL
jgi:putative SOS response-associated peptidase YedK